MPVSSLRLIGGAILLAVGSSAQAGPIYTFANDAMSPGVDGQKGDGSVTSIETRYDAGTNDFTWTYTDADATNDGFWLVVNNGPEPKNPNQRNPGDRYAILYGDIRNDRVTAYVYNGNNNPGSFADRSGYIGTFDDVFTSTGSTVSFTLNTDETGRSIVNSSAGIAAALDTTLANPDRPESVWQGAGFGPDAGGDPTIGIWFHTTYDDGRGNRVNDATLNPNDSAFAYDSLNRITSYDTSTQRWVDRTGLQAQIPEPGILALAGMGLVAFGATRRSRRPRGEAPGASAQV